MSQATADISGKTGSNFVATLDASSVVQAQLAVVGKSPITLSIGADKRSITVPNLPSGDSAIWLALVFAPGEPNATIGVGSVTGRSATPHNPPGIIYDTNAWGVIKLFGS
ncbi:hypothetical protein [Granulicella sp. dw_53]|uniref:hypothetical protein n=1 Tax=Granulicella sp. dw_53 TaxID=2719792 RepID=UPI001BD36F58|nr:hypothetical protein [Granulicella sp. dw_53]